jgi:hypothetical protein
LSIRRCDGPPRTLLAGENDVGIRVSVVGPSQLDVFDIAPSTEVPSQDAANLLRTETISLVKGANMDTARHAAAAPTVASQEGGISITNIHEPVPAVAGRSGIDSGTTAIAEGLAAIG